MSGKQGEALATIGEIIQQHGGLHGTIPVVQPSLFEDIAELVSERPYAATLAALAVGFLGGVSIALSRRGRRYYSRGW